MHSRKQIEKAIHTLVDHRRMTEARTYEHIRSRATSLRVTIAEMAAIRIEAQEAMENLGLGRKGAA